MYSTTTSIGIKICVCTLNWLNGSADATQSFIRIYHSISIQLPNVNAYNLTNYLNESTGDGENKNACIHTVHAHYVLHIPLPYSNIQYVHTILSALFLERTIRVHVQKMDGTLIGGNSKTNASSEGLIKED